MNGEERCPAQPAAENAGEGSLNVEQGECQRGERFFDRSGVLSKAGHRVKNLVII